MEANSIVLYSTSDRTKHKIFDEMSIEAIAVRLIHRGTQNREKTRQINDGGIVRKLKLQMQITVDGFVAGSESQLDWMTPIFDAKGHAFINHLTDTSDTILLGRNMTAGLIKHWWQVSTQSNSLEYPFAQKMVSISKVVFNKTMNRIDGQKVRTVLANRAASPHENAQGQGCRQGNASHANHVHNEQD